MSKKKKKQKKRKSKLNYSTIEQHSQAGKRLIPPLLQVPNLQLNSWRDERLPDLLWAVLLIGNFERTQALAVFRQAAEYIANLSNPYLLADVTHTGIAQAPEEVRAGFINVLTCRQEYKKVLKSLLLFEHLPARSSWEQSLKDEKEIIDIAQLMNSVAKTLDHQSQESTDCRWIRILAAGAANKLLLPSEEITKKLNYYPEYGDMKSVRPSIRAIEGSLTNMGKVERVWPEQFWEECRQKTKCFPLRFSSDINAITIGTTETQLRKVYRALIEHFFSTNKSTAIDIQHDLIFGTAFYCLSILRELLRLGVAQSILARSGLRTLLECYITLRYLIRKNQPDLWKSYRVHGSGQAKLIFLKLDSDLEKPEFINLETLNTLANEDVWQEFLPINLGHWKNSNLRKLSIEADAKDEYDQFYAWTSAYTHGHWGPIRESVLAICGNPLHRLHRIPLVEALPLPDVISDACRLVDKILDLLDKSYPSFQLKVSITNTSSDTSVANDFT